MPIDLYRNDQIYNMVAEGEVANILAHYNSDYIMSIIKNNIANRMNYNYMIITPNIVSSYEMNFKDLMTRYPSDVENIQEVRRETYSLIIKIICQSFGLAIQDMDEAYLDMYMLAFNLYDAFVSGFARNIINFCSRYIIQNKEAIYNNMNLDRYKKDKSSSSSYIKKAYNDTELAMIISKIKEVIYYMSNFDIEMYTFLSYNYDKATCEFLTSTVYPIAPNIFYNSMVAVLNSPSMLTDIRLQIQKELIINSGQSVQVPTTNPVINSSSYDTKEKTISDNEYTQYDNEDNEQDNIAREDDEQW